MTNHLQRLYDATIRAFGAGPEIQEIFLFGSVEQGQHDQYSDLDIYVISCDFHRTMRYLADYFQAIGQILIQLPVHTRRGFVSFVIAFKGYPLYTQLDISILDTIAFSPFAEGRCVYQKEPGIIMPPDTCIPQPFDKSNPLHRLHNAYLDAVSYTKYRKRGNHFSAYKYYRAQLDHYLAKYYQRVTARTQPEACLGCVEYRALDIYSQQAGLDLDRFLYPANEQTMNELYIEFLQEQWEEAKTLIDRQDAETLSTVLTFVRDELSLVAIP